MTLATYIFLKKKQKYTKHQQNNHQNQLTIGYYRVPYVKKHTDDIKTYLYR